MPYKRPGSAYYQCRRKNLPGYGDTGVITSKTKSKRVAAAMERLLEELAERALLEPKWAKLIDAVVERRLDLPALLRAKSERRLPALLRNLHDPVLQEATASFLRTTSDRQVEIGTGKLLELAPDGARLSYLGAGRVVTDLLEEAVARYGIKRTTAQRQLKRAISLLLRYHVGSHERNRIFADVRFAVEDDSREVVLEPVEIARLLKAAEAAHEELPTIVRTALLTSADRGVLLRGERSDGFARGLLRRDLRVYEEQSNGREVYSAEIYLHDTKDAARPRTVQVGDYLARELLLLAQGKKPDDAVFSITYGQLDYVWQKARSEAGLGHLHFKDLRAQTVIYMQRAGIPQAVAQATLGHSDATMTARYGRHQASMGSDQVAALEEVLFGQEEEDGQQCRKSA